MILYFSGTGNSRYVAKKLAEMTGHGLASLNEKIKQKDTRPLPADEGLVFVVPTYAWRLPRVVEHWILATEFIRAGLVWFVMTCGDEIGNAGKYNQHLCAEKDFSYMGTAQIVMPENYIAMFDTPEPEESKEIIRSAGPAIEQAARFIKNKEAFPLPRVGFADRIKSGLVNPAFYPLFVKAGAFTTDAECSGCGKCVQVCPLNNVTLVEERPVWGETCTHCMACIAYCPTGAIEYGKKSVGKLRYRCPD